MRVHSALSPPAGSTGRPPEPPVSETDSRTVLGLPTLPLGLISQSNVALQCGHSATQQHNFDAIPLATVSIPSDNLGSETCGRDATQVALDKPPVPTVAAVRGVKARAAAGTVGDPPVPREVGSKRTRARRGRGARQWTWRILVAGGRMPISGSQSLKQFAMRLPRSSSKLRRLHGISAANGRKQKTQKSLPETICRTFVCNT